MPSRQRNSKGQFKDAAFFTKPRENPGTTAALAAGIAGVAAAGAFLWSRREQIGEAINSRKDRLSEFKAERMGKQEIAEEPLTPQETGKKSKGSRGPSAQQDIKVGLAPVE